MQSSIVKFGISTACLYPMETETALKTLGALGVRRTELFINDLTELMPPYPALFQSIREKYQIEITAVHSCFSPADHFLLFSNYPRRFETGRTGYRLLFSLAKALSAPYVVFHGDRLLPKPADPAAYARVLDLLHADAAASGVLLLQENVAPARCGDPDFLEKVLAATRCDQRITFDVKQARRVHAAPERFVQRFLPAIAHAHLSAADSKTDCCLPAADKDSLAPVLSALSAAPRLTEIILEVYRDCFDKPEALLSACDHLQEEWATATKKELIPWNR